MRGLRNSRRNSLRRNGSSQSERPGRLRVAHRALLDVDRFDYAANAVRRARPPATSRLTSVERPRPASGRAPVLLSPQIEGSNLRRGRLRRAQQVERYARVANVRQATAARADRHSRDVGRQRGSRTRRLDAVDHEVRDGTDYPRGEPMHVRVVAEPGDELAAAGIPEVTITLNANHYGGGLAKIECAGRRDEDVSFRPKPPPPEWVEVQAAEVLRVFLEQRRR